MAFFPIFLSFALTSVRADVRVETQAKASVDAMVGARPSSSSNSPVCTALSQYPRPKEVKLAFESGEIAPLCGPFVTQNRGGLDRCGDFQNDPFVLGPVAAASSDSRREKPTEMSASASEFTWASRSEMARRGMVNLFTDARFHGQQAALLRQVEEIRGEAAAVCCGSDGECRASFDRVEISICRPQGDGDAPDPCVFGGRYDMSGASYTTMYRSLYRLYARPETAELREIAARNLRPDQLDPLRSLPALSLAGPDAFRPIGGKIVLTSYVPEKEGYRALDPTIRHEFGHACSMIRMQLAATGGLRVKTRARALRAMQWLDRVKERCSSSGELSEAYYDFWESIGETRAFASCIYRLTSLNQQQRIDRPCDRLCPGHYLEEAVGIAFSFLTGDLADRTSSPFPNTCHHVRDGQHPMVSDVVECLGQHSARFRNRVHRAFRCEPEGTRAAAVAQSPPLEDQSNASARIDLESNPSSVKRVLTSLIMALLPQR